MESEREQAVMPYDLRRKIVSGKPYLYRITDRSGNGKRGLCRAVRPHHKAGDPAIS